MAILEMCEQLDIEIFLSRKEKHFTMSLLLRMNIEKHLMATAKWSERSIMLWACLSAKGLGNLVRQHSMLKWLKYQNGKSHEMWRVLITPGANCILNNYRFYGLQLTPAYTSHQSKNASRGVEKHIQDALQYESHLLRNCQMFGGSFFC